MIETDIKKATFKHIEAELYSYKDTLKEINRLRQDIMSGGKDTDENIGQGSNSVREAGRPTERIATRLLTHKTLRNLEEIVEAIESAYNALSDDHRRVIDIKYFSGKRLTWDDIAIQANMHRNTATKMRKDVVLIIAEKIGWR